MADKKLFCVTAPGESGRLYLVIVGGVKVFRPLAAIKAVGGKIAAYEDKHAADFVAGKLKNASATTLPSNMHAYAVQQ